MRDKLGLVFKGAVFALIGQGFSKVFTYLYRIVIAREGSEVYGNFSLSIAILGIASTIALMGLISGVQRFVAFYSGRGELTKVKGVITTSLKITTISSILLGIVIFYFIDEISIYFFHSENLSNFLIFFIIALPFLVYKEILLSVLFGFKNIKYIILSRDFLDSITKVLLTAILIYLGYGLFGIALAYVASSIILFLFLLFILETRVFPVFRTPIKSQFIYRELFTYSIPLLLANYIFMFSKWADTVMLGYFRTAGEVGVYNTALPTAMLLLMIPNAMLSIFLPVITSEYSKGRMDSIRMLYVTVVKWIGLMGLPILFIMSLFSSPILIKLFGLEYAAGSTSLVILSAGYFSFALFWPASHLILMIKKTQISFLISLTVASTNILLNWFFIPIFGINGAAMATSFSNVLNGILYGYFAYRYLKIIPFDRRMVYMIIISATLLYISYMIFTALKFRMIFQIFAIILLNLTYLLLIYRLGFISEEEKEIAKKIVRRLKNF